MAKLNKDDIMYYDSELVVHNYDELTMQIIRISDNIKELEKEAKNLNNMFNISVPCSFKAEVLIESVPVYRWQVDGRFKK